MKKAEGKKPASCPAFYLLLKSDTSGSINKLASTLKLREISPTDEEPPIALFEFLGLI